MLDLFSFICLGVCGSMAIGGGGKGGIIKGGNLEVGWERLEGWGGRVGCLLRRGDFLFFFLLPFKHCASFVSFHLSGGLGGAEFAFFPEVSHSV